MKENYSDKKLLELVSSGDMPAFEIIYNRYSKDMFIFAMNVFKKKEVCEDIIQNVFISFWTKREETTISNLKPYLFQAVKFQIFNHLRNQKISTEDLTRFNLVDLSMNISQKIEFNELELIIKEEVDKLPNRCQQIFVLSRYQHKSNKEIALELDISIQAVKNQISKAIRAIKENLTSEEVVFYSLLINFL